MFKRLKKEIKKSVPQLIEEVCADVCDNLCKYRSTCDENAECELMRNGNECPLDRLL